jgi:hypothetical protein
MRRCENGLAYRQRLRNRNPQEAVEVNENINRRRRRRQGQERPQEQRNEQAHTSGVHLFLKAYKAGLELGLQR